MHPSGKEPKESVCKEEAKGDRMKLISITSRGPLRFFYWQFCQDITARGFLLVCRLALAAHHGPCLTTIKPKLLPKSVWSNHVVHQEKQKAFSSCNAEMTSSSAAFAH